MLVTPDLALFQRGSPHCSILVWQRTSSFLAVSSSCIIQKSYFFGFGNFEVPHDIYEIFAQHFYFLHAYFCFNEHPRKRAPEGLKTHSAKTCITFLCVKH